MWRLGVLLAAPAFAQGFDPESGIPEGGLHPRFPAGYSCPPITSYFGSMLDVDGSLREAAHKGIDLGNWGDAILAPADGTVLAAWATDVGYGPEWNLLISHSAADMGLVGSVFIQNLTISGPMWRGCGRANGCGGARSLPLCGCRVGWQPILRKPIGRPTACLQEIWRKPIGQITG